jgi:hypothetical protein
VNILNYEYSTSFSTPTTFLLSLLKIQDSYKKRISRQLATLLPSTTLPSSPPPPAITNARRRRHHHHHQLSTPPHSPHQRLPPPPLDNRHALSTTKVPTTFEPLREDGSGPEKQDRAPARMSGLYILFRSVDSFGRWNICKPHRTGSTGRVWARRCLAGGRGSRALERASSACGVADATHPRPGSAVC